MNKAMETGGPLSSTSKGPGVYGRKRVQVELRPSVGIRTEPGGAGSPALVKGPGVPRTGGGHHQEAGEVTGTAWQCLAGGDGVSGQAFHCQMSSHHALAPQWRNRKLK